MTSSTIITRSTSLPSEPPRIGVYVCHCGSNIAGTVDVEKVTKYASGLPDVTVARHYMYMCSDSGQALIKEDIEKLGLNRVVVASCSPRMHEPTFRKVCESKGLNKYLFEMANLREHCSWAHMHEPEKATGKAMDLVRMAVAKARLLEPLPPMEVEVRPSALVVGGGIAGLTSARDIAQRGFKVTLVERRPVLGGNLAKLNSLFPSGKQASEVIEPIIKDVVTDPNIVVKLSTHVTSSQGFIGNFKVNLSEEPEFVNKKCSQCGECSKVCPVQVPDESDFGLSMRKAIYQVPTYTSEIRTRYVLDINSCTRCRKCLEACRLSAINLDMKPNASEVEAGTIVLVTGFDSFEPNDMYLYGESKDVVTLAQLSRIMNNAGPTKGKLVNPRNNRVPTSIVFISCVGSREEPTEESAEEGASPPRTYCSRVCCAAIAESANTIRERYPDSQVYVLYRDFRTFGKGHEELYRRSRENLVKYIRYTAEKPPEVSENTLGDRTPLKVLVWDDLLNRQVEIPTDMVVLASAIIPSKGATELGQILGVTRSRDGFYLEAHLKLNPLSSVSDGIFLGGVAQGPKDSSDSASQGSGTAGKASALLAQGRVQIESSVSSINEDKCGGCGICEGACIYGAIEMKKIQGSKGKRVAHVIEAVCKGCGTCGAGCPSGAIRMKHFTDAQITEMIKAAM